MQHVYEKVGVSTRSETSALSTCLLVLLATIAMRAFTLAALLALGCGTAAPSKDGAAAAGGRPTATGGVGGRMDAGPVEAGLATSGPCAGLCANPFTAEEEYDGQGIGMGNNPPGSCYAITIVTQPYTAGFWCNTPDVQINGTTVACQGDASNDYFPVPPESDGDYCVSFGPGASAHGFVEIR